MHKPHLVLAATGLGGMLALTLMMQHLLSVHTETKAGGKVAHAFAAQFGRHLEEPPQLAVRISDDEMAEGIAVTAKVRPKPTADEERLLAEMGSFLWSARFEEGQPYAITISCRDAKTGEVTKHRIPPPARKRSLPPAGPIGGR